MIFFIYNSSVFMGSLSLLGVFLLIASEANLCVCAVVLH